MNKVIVLLFFGLWSVTGFATVLPKITIKGTVKSFDQNTVVLEQDQHKFTIPRSAFGKHQLKSGEKVSVEVDRKQIFAEK